VAVTDTAIVEAIHYLARHCGVLAEPAAAASLAGLRAALKDGLVGDEERIVLLITGHGLKDVRAVSRGVDHPDPVEPNLDAVAERLRL
jgi:threonine synthase